MLSVKILAYSTNLEEQNALGGRCDGDALVDALPYEPHNASFIGEDGRGELFEAGEVAVGEKIAHQFGAFHAEGTETVGFGCGAKG